MNLFYKLFYKGFLKYHEGHKLTKDDLVYAFTDFEGNRYFTWSDKGQIPKVRYDRLMELTIWWEARVAPETVDRMADGIIEAAELSLTGEKPEDRSKMVSKVIVLANELKLRKENGLPQVIANEMAAVWAIREDEDPEVINNQIHEEKVDMFAHETAMGRNFFFRLPRLMKHLDLWRVSRNELRKLFAESETKEKRMDLVMNQILSDFSSETTIGGSGQ